MMKFGKIRNKLKQQNNNDLIEPILYGSSIKLLELVYTALKVLFQ